MATNGNLPVRENSFMFNAPEGDVSIDEVIDAIERAAGEDSVLVLQHMGGSRFLVCTRNANQATCLMVVEGFRVDNEKVTVEAMGPPTTYVTVYRFLAYIPDEILVNALAQYGKVKGTTRSGEDESDSAGSDDDDDRALEIVTGSSTEEDSAGKAQDSGHATYLARRHSEEFPPFPSVSTSALHPDDMPIVCCGRYVLPPDQEKERKVTGANANHRCH
ncbi:hypothetical protein MRX96_042215 [Rhipicephalus microplus]